MLKLCCSVAQWLARRGPRVDASLKVHHVREALFDQVFSGRGAPTAGSTVEQHGLRLVEFADGYPQLPAAPIEVDGVRQMAAAELAGRTRIYELDARLLQSGIECGRGEAFLLRGGSASDEEQRQRKE